MTLNELIKQLEFYKRAHGNMNVFVVSRLTTGLPDPNDIAEIEDELVEIQEVDNSLLLLGRIVN